jgi:uncharacterized caspase-like protein
VIICSHCDRGNIYCAGECAAQARKEKQAKAQKAYQNTPEGQRLHALRQQAYRQRQLQKVTHQSSQSLVPYDQLTTPSQEETTPNEPPLREPEVALSIGTAVNETLDVTKEDTVAKKPVRHCHFCGCRCSEALRDVFLYRQNRHSLVVPWAFDCFPAPVH